MELALFLLKGILIGLLFGIPVGAVGTMTIHRSVWASSIEDLVAALGDGDVTVTFSLEKSE